MTSLSVICAFHDSAHFLPTLLTSLDQAQIDDMEILLVDDGSSDGPASVVAAHRADFDELEIVRLDESVGPASARNRGMERATGTYLAFVDADDWIGPSYLSDLVSAMEATDADFGRTDQTRVEGRVRAPYLAPDYRYRRRLDPRSAILPADRATMVDYPYTHSGVFHRRLLERGLLRMPEGLRTAEDRPWIWGLHLLADAYVRIPTVEYFYRRGVTTSLTQVGDDRQLDFVPACKLVIELVTSKAEWEPFVDKAVRQCLSVAARHLALADRLEQGLYPRMVAGIAEMLDEMPQDHLKTQLRELGWRRADLIRSVDRELHRL